ncbi:MAG TPA: hypothetical protein VK543_15600, partial [Puia sp.]|nr:hypothetical protein [Puia sp.]
MKLLIRISVFMVLMQACSKGHSTPPVETDLGKPYALPTGPAANALYDGSSAGIYKGVTINAQDSLATFQFNIANNDERVYALEYMYGLLRDSMVRYKMDTATQLLKFPNQEDSSVLVRGNFFHSIFGSYKPYFGGNATADFAAEADGSFSRMNVNLNANQTLDAVLKERSGMQVYCYEGSYEGSYTNPVVGSDNGPIAFVLTADSAVVIQASKAFGQFFPSS